MFPEICYNRRFPWNSEWDGHSSTDSLSLSKKTIPYLYLLSMLALQTIHNINKMNLIARFSDLFFQGNVFLAVSSLSLPFIKGWCVSIILLLPRGPREPKVWGGGLQKFPESSFPFICRYAPLGRRRSGVRGAAPRSWRHIGLLAPSLAYISFHLAIKTSANVNPH